MKSDDAILELPWVLSAGATDYCVSPPELCVSAGIVCLRRIGAGPVAKAVLDVVGEVGVKMPQR